MHDIAQHVAAEAQVLLRDKTARDRGRRATRIVIKTDAAKVQQIVTNLVSNAVKFTDKGSVTIEVTPTEEGGCAIAVKDTGIGIRREDLQLIFEEFRQVDGTSTRRYSGTGLGLAIARRFAHLLGGTITVESTVGVGSTFTLTLPPEPRARPPAPAAAARRIGSVRQCRRYRRRLRAAEEIHQAMDQGPCCWSRTTRTTARSSAACSATPASRVVEAEDGHQALAAVAKALPDVILDGPLDPRRRRLGGHAPPQGATPAPSRCRSSRSPPTPCAATRSAPAPPAAITIWPSRSRRRRSFRKSARS